MQPPAWDQMNPAPVENPITVERQRHSRAADFLVMEILSAGCGTRSTGGCSAILAIAGRAPPCALPLIEFHRELCLGQLMTRDSGEGGCDLYK